jgi:hypothetical protein
VRAPLPTGSLRSLPLRRDRRATVRPGDAGAGNRVGAAVRLAERSSAARYIELVPQAQTKTKCVVVMRRYLVLLPVLPEAAEMPRRPGWR